MLQGAFFLERAEVLRELIMAGLDHPDLKGRFRKAQALKYGIPVIGINPSKEEVRAENMSTDLDLQGSRRFPKPAVGGSSPPGSVVFRRQKPHFGPLRLLRNSA